MAPDAKAIFYLVTYVLQNTDFDGTPLISRISSVICVLAEDEVNHTHPLTGQVARVDGWRLHLLVDNITPDALDTVGWCRLCTPLGALGGVDHTHTAFGYMSSYRDHRQHESTKGPFLQLVLDENNTSADSDLDEGRYDHDSSPLDIHDRFRKRYPAARPFFGIE